MINIRRNVFETNSSSMHSLVVSKKVIPYTKEELRLGYNPQYDKKGFELWKYFYDSADMIYERSPFRILHTPLDKLRYVSAYLLGGYHDMEHKEEYLNNRIQLITNLIMKQTGITDPTKIKLYKERKDWDYGTDMKNYKVVKDYGTVYDNESGENPMDFVKRKGIDFEDLILNPKYTIIVDGDEIQDFKGLFEAGIIDADNLEDISENKDFWNDSDLYTNIYWIDKDPLDECLDYVEDHISEYKKYITIGVDCGKEDRKEVFDRLNKKSNTKKIKAIISKAKELNPKIKSRLYGYTFETGVKLSNNIFENTDISMYDIVEVENKLDD